MNNITTSIIIPVGFEFSGLDKCLESFIGKNNRDNYEIIIGIDDGDYKNIGIALEYQDKLPLKTIMFKRNGSHHTMHLKTNRLAKEARGEFIWWWSDEVRMMTKHWVGEFIRFREKADEPILIQPKTITVDGAKYPAINRCWYKKTGEFTGHPSLDSWLNTIRERAKLKTEMLNVLIAEKERD